MGIRLRQEGIEDFEIFERGETVGGVWRANTYPGAACDVPSHLYSFSFAPGHNWSRRYAPQPEILNYMEEITDRFAMRPHLRLGTEVTEARSTRRPGGGRSDGRRRLARVRRAGNCVRTADSPAGSTRRGHRGLRGAACSTPPSGITRMICRGRNVAVIGTGASAIQFVPEIAKEACDPSRSTSARHLGSWRRQTASTPSGSAASSSASRRGSLRHGPASSRFSKRARTGSPGLPGC